MRLTGLPFDEWIEHAFAHEVRFQQASWFFDPDHDWWDPEPGEAVSHLTRLFTEPEHSLRWFSDEQIAQGLTYLVSTRASGDNGWLCSKDVPVDRRVRCVEAVASLFAQLFAARCSSHLLHLSEAGASTLNRVCYMWWDEFPCIALPSDPHIALMHDTALRTMESVLRLGFPPCQESALHGLGHWHRGHESKVAQIIDRFLATTTPLDPRIVTYSKSARCGCVL